MALTLNFTAYQSDDGKSIVFHETTGGATVVTGWGNGTNPATTDATVANVEIVSVDNSIDTPTPVDIISTFPSDTDTTQWNFQMDVVEVGGAPGLAGDIFPDGIYKLVYTVEAPALTEYDKTRYIFCDYYIRCCIRKMFAAIDISNCNCDSDDVCRAIKTRAYWNATRYAVETGNFQRAEILYDLLYDLCVNSGYCSGC